MPFSMPKTLATELAPIKEEVNINKEQDTMKNSRSYRVREEKFASAGKDKEKGANFG